MGTRGAYGFHKNGVDKISYCHFDSYPTGLGNNIKKFISNHTINEMNEIFDRIIMIDNSDQGERPTQAQAEECAQYTDLTVAEKSTSDWYCLLRYSQGELEAYAEGLRYMIDNADFLKDSLFCEWGYVINLDTNRLEIYKGFQKSPQDNRYKLTDADRIHKSYSNGYENCKLEREVPLKQVKNFDMKKFEKELEGEDD